MNLHKINHYNIPLSLYIHFPWCIKKCPYCDFNSYVVTRDFHEKDYIFALLRDLENDFDKVQNRKLNSIFFGGGTPSLLSADGVYFLLEKINKMFSFEDKIEITLEANPSSIEQKYLLDYKHAGINRISLGAQSFQDEKLSVLGRIHSSKEIFAAVEKIKQAGFYSFNIDIMHGLPEQTIDDALYDLHNAISCEPQHISWYELTIEPHTVFYKNNITLPKEQNILKIQEEGIKFLQHNNLSRYEISAFAKKNLQCKHNINYWEFGDYIGIGAGAHSKITNLKDFTIHRSCKKKNPLDYLNNVSLIEEEHILETKKIPLEFMLNALRLISGFHKSLFETRTNLSFSQIDAIVNKARDLKMLATHENKIIPTHKGILFLNDLLQLFV